MPFRGYDDRTNNSSSRAAFVGKAPRAVATRLRWGLHLTKPAFVGKGSRASAALLR